jgi:hypothetical protein
MLLFTCYKCAIGLSDIGSFINQQNRLLWFMVDEEMAGGRGSIEGEIRNLW